MATPLFIIFGGVAVVLLLGVAGGVYRVVRRRDKPRPFGGGGGVLVSPVARTPMYMNPMHTVPAVTPATSADGIARPRLLLDTELYVAPTSVPERYGTAGPAPLQPTSSTYLPFQSVAASESSAGYAAAAPAYQVFPGTAVDLRAHESHYDEVDSNLYATST